MIRAEFGVTGAITIGHRPCGRDRCYPNRPCQSCQDGGVKGRGGKGRSRVAVPDREQERWDVFADHKDGRGYQYVGEHRGPATSFRPPTPRQAPAKANPAPFPPTSPYVDPAPVQEAFTSAVADAVENTADAFTPDPADFLP